MAALSKRGRVAIIDASSLTRKPPGLDADAIWLPPAHQGIPGALWLAGVGAAALSAAQEFAFREQLARLSHQRMDFDLIFYCHEQCWLSFNAAKRAISYGYTRVAWFADGIEGWKAAGFPTKVLPAYPGFTAN